MLRRRKEYFKALMDEENEKARRVHEVETVEQEVRKMSKDEIREALRRMKNGKAVGPVEIWKSYCVSVDRHNDAP